MSAIDDFKRLHSALLRIEDWCALIGSPYHGGGGGIGELRSIEVKACVYHQSYNGATNYHNSDKEFNDALAVVIKRNFNALKNEALADLRATSTELALKASSEYAELLQAAGLRAASEVTGT